MKLYIPICTECRCEECNVPRPSTWRKNFSYSSREEIICNSLLYEIINNGISTNTSGKWVIGRKYRYLKFITYYQDKYKIQVIVALYRLKYPRLKLRLKQ